MFVSLPPINLFIIIVIISVIVTIDIIGSNFVMFDFRWVGNLTAWSVVGERLQRTVGSCKVKYYSLKVCYQWMIRMLSMGDNDDEDDNDDDDSDDDGVDDEDNDDDDDDDDDAING